MAGKKLISDAGEFGLIDEIKKLAERMGAKTGLSRKAVAIGIGDDAAALDAGVFGNKLILFTTDTLVESVHFRKDWFLPEEIGRKAVEVNVSDIAAMGGKPLFMLASFVLPKSLEKKTFDGITRGLMAASKKYGIAVIGGNISRGEKIHITLSLIGSASREELCLRSGAKPGDFIFVSRPLGAAAAGLALYQNAVSGFEPVKKKFRNPEADLSFPKKLLLEITSMIDISDGLLGDLGHICAASSAGAALYGSNIPIYPGAVKAAFRLNRNPLDFALRGGEEYALLYTLPEQHLSSSQGFLIGEITRRKGITLFDHGRKRLLTPKGFDHFL